MKLSRPSAGAIVDGLARKSTPLLGKGGETTLGNM